MLYVAYVNVCVMWTYELCILCMLRMLCVSYRERERGGWGGGGGGGGGSEE